MGNLCYSGSIALVKQFEIALGFAMCYFNRITRAINPKCTVTITHTNLEKGLQCFILTWKKNKMIIFSAI